jgi:hypothetical protein
MRVMAGSAGARSPHPASAAVQSGKPARLMIPLRSVCLSPLIATATSNHLFFMQRDHVVTLCTMACRPTRPLPCQTGPGRFGVSSTCTSIDFSIAINSKEDDAVKGKRADRVCYPGQPTSTQQQLHRPRSLSGMGNSPDSRMGPSA